MVVTHDSVGGAFHWGLRRVLDAGYGQDMLVRNAPSATPYGPKMARLYFGLPPRPERNPPLLMNSSVTARQTVAVLKSKWQTRFVGGFIVTGLLLFLTLGVVLWRNQKQVKQGWMEHGGSETGAPGTRAHFLWDVGYIFLVLAAFLFGIIQLLLSIHW